MKSFNLLFLGIFISACNLTEVNTDPNLLTDVEMSEILPRAQFQVVNATYNDCAPICGIFMQYFQGNPSTQFTRINNYEIDNSFYVQDVWNAFYTNPMEYCKIIIEKAEVENAPHYRGIAKVLMAYSLGTLSSIWGDIPYSDAFQGSLNLNPAYDSQETIYSTIQLLLNQALADFNMPSGNNSPGVNDIYFNGDIQSWIRTAHALKARYFLHLTKKTNELSYNPADSALYHSLLAFTSDENLEYPYGYSSSEENSFSRGKNETDLVTTDFFGNQITIDDPRRGNLVARKFGKWDVGPFYASRDSKLPLITYFEVKFIEAEARLRINTNDPETEVALKEAVRSNITKITAADTTVTSDEIETFINATIALSGIFDDDLNLIITQKYLAMYMQPESWTDYRRTGFPVLTPNPEGDNAYNSGGGIPRRFPYVWTEKELNANCPTGGNQMQDRFWWDVE